jgi:hypothetical protein
MSSVKCFMITPTGRAARWLRRFQGAEEIGVRLCEPNSYHNAMVRIEDTDVIQGERSISIDPMTWPEDDPRWPARCEHCGYEFAGMHGGQLFYAQIYKTPDGKEVSIHGSKLPGIEQAPPGSMYYADWLKPYHTSPDGHSLAVMTPAGVWLIDLKTKDANWTRTGTPPNVTATPSIRIGDRYHGWLKNGELVEC